MTHLTGRADTGEILRIQISAPDSPAANYAFDVTPTRLGLITERGVCPANAGVFGGCFRRGGERTKRSIDAAPAC